MLRRPIAFLLLLAALLGVPTPARGASTPLALLASAAQTATGQGGAIPAAGIRELVVMVDLTAVSGTNPRLSLYLQSTRDGGTTWFDLPHDGAIVLSSGATEGISEPRGKRNILSDASATLKATAQYEGAFGNSIRVAWVISGTGSPTFTFQVDGIGKN